MQASRGLRPRLHCAAAVYTGCSIPIVHLIYLEEYCSDEVSGPIKLLELEGGRKKKEAFVRPNFKMTAVKWPPYLIKKNETMNPLFHKKKNCQIKTDNFHRNKVSVRFFLRFLHYPGRTAT